MPSSLRLLLVEDSENDALLIVRELRSAGYYVTTERVESAEAMKRALNSREWDLVIADYNMPQFSGIAALDLLRDTDLDIPFFIISGSIGEELAVEAMKAGAHDYMMKGNLKRLFPSIERELREAKMRREHRQSELHVKQQWERLQALNDINLAVTSTLDLEGVLRILLEKLDIVLPYAATTVRLFNRETGEFEPVACRNVDEKEWKALNRKEPSGFAKILLANKTALTVSDVRTDPRSVASDFARKQGLVSYVGVPLIAQGEVLGLIAFYTRERHSFSDDEIAFLTTVAGQAAMAIHNSQLYENVSRAKTELELTNQRLAKSVKELSGFYAALVPLRPSETIQEMMDGVLARMLEGAGADAGLIRINSQGQRNYPIAGQRGFPEYYIKRVEAAPTGGATAWVIEHGEPIIAPDIAAEPRLKGKVQLDAGLRSCAILPLKVHDKATGLIHLVSRQIGYFNDEKKDYLVAIARQMSIALENRKLYDTLKHSNDELQKAYKVKSEFLGVMSHELRTPLNVIRGFVSLLQDNYFGDVNSQQQYTLTKVANQTDVLLTMITSIMDATKIESGAVALEVDKFDLAGLLDELKGVYQTPVDREPSLIWEYSTALPQMTTDRAKLKTILQNLIDNAIKFTDKGSITISARRVEKNGPLTVSVAQLSQGVQHGLPTETCASGALEYVEIKVKDTGTGIPKVNLPIIFDMFRQIDGSDTRLHGGVGLGLYIVKKLTNLLGGEVEVESEPGRGSTFTVCLPVG